MHIAYVVPFPLQGAVGQRVHTVARAMLAADDLVESVQLVAPECSLDLSADERIAFRATAVSGHGGSILDKVRRRLDRGADAVAALDALAIAPDVVMIYGGGAVFMGALVRWAHGHGAAVAADVVEWYDSSHLPLGRYGPYAWDNHLMMTRSLRRVDGAIVISRFLEAHLRSLGVTRLVRVPPLADRRAAEVVDTATRDDRVRLAYCGNPGRKDRLDLVVRAIAEVDPKGERVRLDIAGVDADQLTLMYGLDALPQGVNAWGRVPHVRALDLLGSADFMPLVREDERFAQAGFPTKVVEALSLGVAPWVNLTSDLGEHLTDGVNAVVILGSDQVSVTESLRRLVALPRPEVDALRSAAANSAVGFTVESASARVGSWLKALVDAANTRRAA